MSPATTSPSFGANGFSGRMPPSGRAACFVVLPLLPRGALESQSAPEEQRSNHGDPGEIEARERECAGRGARCGSCVRSQVAGHGRRGAVAGDYRVTAGRSPGEDERNGYHHDEEEHALHGLVTFPNIDSTTAIPSAGRGQQV